MQIYIDFHINIHFTDHGGRILNYPQCSNASQHLQTSAKWCIKVVKIIFKFYMKLSGSTNLELKWEPLDFLFSFTTKLAHVRNMIVLYDYENKQLFSLQHLHKLCQMCSLFIIFPVYLSFFLFIYHFADGEFKKFALTRVIWMHLTS